MSQPNVPFDRGDPNHLFLPTECNQQYQTHSQQIATHHSNDDPHFSSRNDPVLNHVDFSPHSRDLPAANLTNHSTTVTSDLADTTFPQHILTYSSPKVDWPHPYPLENERNHSQHQIPTAYQRPLPIHAHTNSSFLLPCQILSGYVRRRSLSHGDAEFLTATSSNPTFVRLQATRPRSRTPEEKGQVGARSRHGRSSSHGHSQRGRSMKSGMPYSLQGTALAGGMLPTSIGTPIGTPLDEVDAHTWTGAAQGMNNSANLMETEKSGLPLSFRLDADPFLYHMTHPTALAQSRRIIQIGAMAAHNHTPIDPNLKEMTTVNHQERALHQLDEVERYLKQDENDHKDALRGCTTIREALNRRHTPMDTHLKVELDGENDDGAPSKMMTEYEDHFGHSQDDHELLSMLSEVNDMHDHEVNDY